MENMKKYTFINFKNDKRLQIKENKNTGKEFLIIPVKVGDVSTVVFMNSTKFYKQWKSGNITFTIVEELDYNMINNEEDINWEITGTGLINYLVLDGYNILVK